MQLSAGMHPNLQTCFHKKYHKFLDLLHLNEYAYERYHEVDWNMSIENAKVPVLIGSTTIVRRAERIGSLPLTNHLPSSSSTGRCLAVALFNCEPRRLCSQLINHVLKWSGA